MTRLLLDGVDAWWQWMSAMSVQVAFLASLVAVIDWLLPRRAWPQLRSALWWLVVLKLVLPPTLSSPVSLARMGGAVLADCSGAGPAKPISVGSLVAFGSWLAVTITLIGLTAWRHRRLCQQWLAGPEQALPSWLEEVARRLAGQLKLACVPRLVIRAGARGPAVLGFVRPIVIVPAELLAASSRVEVEHILLHEFAHLRRRDPLACLVCLGVQFAYWFHPAAWLAQRRLATLREQGCDWTVAGLLDTDVAAYRRTLLRQAQPLLEGLSPGWLAFFPRQSQLLGRLDLLEQFSPDRPWARRAATAALGSVILLSAVPLARPIVQRPASLPQLHDTMPTESPLDGLQGSLQVRYAVLGMLAEQERRGGSLSAPEGEQ